MQTQMSAATPSSPNSVAAARYTSSGTRPSCTSVIASARASAVFSRASNNVDRCQANSASRRSGASPAVLASRACRSMQNSQPLICETRRRNRSSSRTGNPTWAAESAAATCSARIAADTSGVTDFRFTLGSLVMVDIPQE